MGTRHDLTHHPVVPFDPEKITGVAALLNGMRDTSFQARTLGTAFDVWQAALRDKTLIFLGLAGAMVPAGMRKTIRYLIRERLVDVVVTTGANVFHDLYESLGHSHYKCNPEVNDVMLRGERLDRMYDVLGDDRVYHHCDHFIANVAREFRGKPTTTPEFFHRLGVRLAEHGKEDGILTTAARAGVPLYSSAPNDSSFGIAIASENTKGVPMHFDTIKDVKDMGEMCGRARTTAVIFVGGGSPKNYTQQAWVTAEYLGLEGPGHKYCLQFTADAPHWGGLSGCTFTESQSWGKIDPNPKIAVVYGDATIPLCTLTAGLAELGAAKLRTHLPAFGEPGKMKFRFEPIGAPAKKQVRARR